MKHLVAFIGLFVSGIIYWAGYVGGQNGVWWAAFGLIFVYVAIYKLIET